MSEAEKILLEELRNAINDQSAEGLSDAVSDFSAYCYKTIPPASESPPLSKELIIELMGLIGSVSFLNMKESFKALILFQSDWGRMSPELQLQVCQFLASLYGKFKDSTSQLVIAELLGEYLANAHGLSLLRGLQSTTDETARAYVVHGYKRLFLTALDSELKESAKKEVLAMTKDPVELVRRDAEAAIKAMS